MMALGCAGTPARVAEVPSNIREFAAFDRVIQRTMDKAGVLGCGIAVTRDGRLAYERGYGRIQRSERGRTTTTRTRFRIASLTKPITAVAIYRLVELGLLELDAPVLTALGTSAVGSDAPMDPRWHAIRVRHLLEHTGGWDRERTFDPMFRNAWIAEALDEPLPLELDSILAFMLRQPLDFDPGTEFAYSNFGYTLLGKVIEHVTGRPYAEWVQAEVLGPMGITRMELGRERPEERPEDETAYFPDPEDPLLPNLFSAEHELVSPADGGFYMRPMAAHGGFIASAADYARFLVHVDGLPNPPDLLSPASMAAMLARPSYVPEGADAYYAHGFDVEILPDGRPIWFHTGAKPGTVSLGLRNVDGISYVGLCNGRPLDFDFGDMLDDALVEAIATVRAWPEVDPI